MSEDDDEFNQYGGRTNGGYCPVAERWDLMEKKVAAIDSEFGSISEELKNLNIELIKVLKWCIKTAFSLVAAGLILGGAILAILLIKDSNKSLNANFGGSHLGIETPLFSPNSSGNNRPQ